MESVPEEDLKQMEFLLNHSKNGTHILFENQEIERVMSRAVNDSDYFNIDRMQSVQNLLSALVLKKSLIEKKAFLNGLDEESYELVIRAYFHIIENTVFTNMDHLH